MNYDIILLDADMTIWDFDASEKCALRDVTASLGLTLTPAMEAYYHQVNAEYWRRFDLKEVTREQLTAGRFADYIAYLGVNADPAEVNRRYEHALGKYSIMLPGALEMVQALAEKYPLYIVTNGLHNAQTGRFEKSPVKPYISGLFISQDMDCQKPEKAFYDKVFFAIGVTDPRRYIMVGDSLTSDIQGGINAGIDTIWYNPNHKPRNPNCLPTYEAHSMDEILKILL